MKREDQSEHRLKQLIQQSGTDKPSPDFTAIIMEEVMAQEEIVINPILKSILKRNDRPVLTTDFTRQVMVQIETHQLNKPQPIISRRTWYTAAAALILLISYIVFFGQPTSVSGGVSTYLVITGNGINSLFKMISSIQPLYAITFVSLSALVVLDYFLKSRTNHQNRVS
jgi:hypothetical protein